MSANRMHFPNTVHFITNRTENEMFLLLPTENVTKIIQGWFARALCRFGEGLEIYAFIFLSNHFHILANDTKGTLATFMCYFQANVAKEINRELGRKGSFWAREYDDMIVDGDNAFWNRYAYTLANAVKAGLVDKSDQWIGWSSLAGVRADGMYNFKMLNRTKLHNASRRGQKVDKSQFIETWSFALTTPPTLAGKDDDEKRRHINLLLESAEAEYRALRSNKQPLGVKNVLRQRPTERPMNPSFRPRIKVFSLDPDRREELLESYRTFVGIYREIFDGYRNAAAEGCRPTVDWPPGSYPPSCCSPTWYKHAV